MAILALLCPLVMIGILIVIVVGTWKMFVKAGKPGWAAIVPIYHTIVLLEIVGKPIWWIVFFFIPIVSLVNVWAESFGSVFPQIVDMQHISHWRRTQP